MTEYKMRRLKNVGTYSVFMFLFAVSVAGFFGCSGKPVDENDPASLMADAESDIKDDQYEFAVTKLRTIRNKFPYSKYSVDAQLRLADVYFLQENYIEAASAYETFRDLHPKNEKVSYAMFRIGKSYFKDIPDPISRDLTSAQKASDAYNEFLLRFPNTPEATEARADLAASRKALADKELYIADFYYKRDFYDSAKARYQRIMELYPESQAATPAKEKLAKIAEYEAKEQAKKDKLKESAENG